MKALSPLTLLQMADKKVCVLQNAGLWNQSETTSIMALKAQIDRQQATQQQFLTNLVANIGALTQKLHQGIKKPPHRHPEWMVAPPT